jgi:hypothetical protein
MKLFNVITTPFEDSKDGLLYYEKQDQGNKNNQNLVIQWNMNLENAEWFFNKEKAIKVFEKLKQICPEVKLQSVELIEEET